MDVNLRDVMASELKKNWTSVHKNVEFTRKFKPANCLYTKTRSQYCMYCKKKDTIYADFISLNSFISLCLLWDIQLAKWIPRLPSAIFIIRSRDRQIKKSECIAYIAQSRPIPAKQLCIAVWPSIGIVTHIKVLIIQIETKPGSTTL